MYQKAKSCVKVNNEFSAFFASHTGVRQGENLSPVLFSLFLNDLNEFLASKYNGLQLLSENINKSLSDDDTDVFLKLYMLLYADDTVILAESATELQNALDGMSEYCNIWGLQVNAAKTKIVVVWKCKRGLKTFQCFILNRMI